MDNNYKYNNYWVVGKNAFIFYLSFLDWVFSLDLFGPGYAQIFFTFYFEWDGAPWTNYQVVRN